MSASVYIIAMLVMQCTVVVDAGEKQRTQH